MTIACRYILLIALMVQALCGHGAGVVSNGHVPDRVEISEYQTFGQIPVESMVTGHGMLSVTVPIEVPPGMNGMTPTLSFSYSTSRDNGPCGIGWSIGGISTISRVTKSIYFDSNNSPVRWNDDDALTLDGIRLVKVSQGAGDILYRTVTGDIKVIARRPSGSIAYFEAYYPDGKSARFGTGTSSYAIPDYPITELRDAHGNTISYSYHKAYEHYSIDRIEYNGGALIEFNYARIRPECTVAYMSGRRSWTPERLESVTTYLDKKVQRRYVLEYSTKHRRSFLKRIYCSIGNAMPKELVFYYGTGNDSERFLSEVITLPTLPQKKTDGKYRYVRGRFDRASKSEGIVIFPDLSPHEYTGDETIAIYPDLSSENLVPLQVKTEKQFLGLLCLDLDGDNVDEVVRINRTGTIGALEQIAFTRFSKSPLTGDMAVDGVYSMLLPISCQFTGSTMYVAGSSFMAGDFDGDGRMEIMAISPGVPDGKIKSQTVIADILNNKILYNGELMQFTIRGENGLPSDSLMIFDVDGDGKSDILHIHPDGADTHSFVSTTNCLMPSETYSTTDITLSGIAGHTVIPGDINGDGLTDLLISPKVGAADSQWYIRYSQGNGKFDFQELKICRHTSSGTYILEDINSDGCADLVVGNGSTMTAYTGLRDSDTRSVSTRLTDTDAYLLPVNIHTQGTTTSIIGIRNEKISVYDFGTAYDLERLMSGYSDSYGRITKIGYRRLSDTESPIYSLGERPEYPWIHLNTSNPVVWAEEVWFDGSPVTHTTYRYRDGAFHRHGLGFCGFGEVESSTPQGTVTSRYAHTLLGALIEEDTPYANTRTEYSLTVDQYKSFRLLPVRSLHVDKLTGYSDTTVMNYDRYGYQIARNTVFSDGFKVTETIHHLHTNNDGPGYRLGVRWYARSVRANASGEIDRLVLSDTDSAGMPVKELHSIGGKSELLVRYRYDRHGNLLNRSTYSPDSLSIESETYTYDSHGRVVDTYDRFGILRAHNTYDSWGRVTNVSDKFGKSVLYTYDDCGRQTRVARSDSCITTVTYRWDRGIPGSLWSMTTVGDGMPEETEYFDAFDRPVRKSTRRFNGSVLNTDTRYDILGHVVARSDPFKGGPGTATGNWAHSYTYDEYGRPLTHSRDSVVLSETRYEGCSVTTTELGKTTTRKFDSQGGLVEARDTTGRLSFVLAPDGLPVSVTTDRGQTTAFTYDDLRRRTAVSDPCSGLTQWAYDTRGNIISQINAAGQTVRFLYNRDNLVWQKVTPTVRYTYTYDSRHRLTGIRGKSWTESRVYDDFDRIVRMSSMCDSVKLTRDYVYERGVLTYIAYETGTGLRAKEIYTYANGTLHEVRLDSTRLIYCLQKEDARGRATSIRGRQMVWKYSYDDFDYPSCIDMMVLPVQQLFPVGPSEPDSMVVFGYGNVEMMSPAGVGTTPGPSIYPEILGRSDMKETYVFDHRTANLLRRSCTIQHSHTEDFDYDVANRMVSYGGAIAEYDDYGNLVARSDVGRFTYGIKDRPYAMDGTALIGKDPRPHHQYVKYSYSDRPLSISQGDWSATWTYDSDDMRTRMVVSRNDTTHLTRYYLDECYEVDYSGGHRTERLYLLGQDYYGASTVLVSSDGDEQIFDIGRDYLGSVVLVAGDKDGKVQAVTYDAWGAPRISLSETEFASADDRLFLGRGYTGHEHLPWFGLINMNARLYDPQCGRMLSPDILVPNPDVPSNYNRYIYCMNNPMQYVDKDGKYAHVIIGALVGGGINVAFHWDAIMAAGGGWKSIKKGAAYFGVGAVSGAVVTALALPIMQVSACLGPLGTAVAGGIEGMIGGAIEGFGNKLVEGGSWDECLSAASSEASRGAAFGATFAIPNKYLMKTITVGCEAAISKLRGIGVKAVPATAPSAITSPVTNVDDLPLQVHHFMTNKHKRYSKEFRRLIEPLGLDLDDSFNKMRLPHRGSHPHKYHDWVLENVEAIINMPNMNAIQFQIEFRHRVIQPVMENPLRLRKEFYK